MKLHLPFLIVLWWSCFSSSLVNAQKISPEIALFTEQICDCLTKHNPVKDKKFYKIVEKVYKLSFGENKAYINALPKNQKELFIRNLDTIERLERTNPTFKSCTETAMDKARGYEEKTKALGMTNEEVTNEIRLGFQRKKACYVLSVLYNR